MKKRVLLWCGRTIVVLVIGLLGWSLLQPYREMKRMEHTANSMVGNSEAELLKALGQPRYIVTTASLAGRTVDYPWQGMNFVPVPTRPVRNKVLLYSKLNMAIYVYVDERGIVEHVATAGT